MECKSIAELEDSNQLIEYNETDCRIMAKLNNKYRCKYVENAPTRINYFKDDSITHTIEECLKEANYLKILMKSPHIRLLLFQNPPHRSNMLKLERAIQICQTRVQYDQMMQSQKTELIATPENYADERMIDW